MGSSFLEGTASMTTISRMSSAAIRDLMPADLPEVVMPRAASVPF